ncbi:MAG: prefoldin subunit alpha [Asgard group archaeon]|nr:prefoldin subunit alpha [Asgard group archaeon]
MSNEELQRQLQQISSTIQQFEEYAKQIQTQLESLNTYSVDLNRSKTTLSNLQKEENLEESLIQIGSGVMIKAKPLDIKNVLYNAGAGVIVDKPIEDTVKKIEERIDEVENEKQNLSNQLQQIYEQMANLERQGQSIIQKLQGPSSPQYDPNLVS